MLISMSSYSQIMNIENMNGTSISGAYYKDINNLLDPYVGTWLYSNGADTLKIKLRKVTMTPSINNSYEDLIVGEYQYVANGVEKINTLNNFNTDYPMQYAHKINGNSILENHDVPPCNSCNPNEKRLSLSLTEPLSKFGARLTIRLTTEAGQPALKISKWITAPPVITTDVISSYNGPIIEISSDFTMIKQ